MEDARNHTYPLSFMDVPLNIMAQQLSIIAHDQLVRITIPEFSAQVCRHCLSASHFLFFLFYSILFFLCCC